MNFPMTSLLRPEQAQEMVDEKETLKRKLSNPHIQDKPTVSQQLRRIDKQLETSLPKPAENVKEEENLSRREKVLHAEMLEGMPSQEEMRKCPPGAIGKHQKWEKMNKAKMMEWKHIRLRQNAGGTDPDIANFERYRPTGSSLNMDNAQIPGKDYYLPSEQYKENFGPIFRPEEVEKKEGKGLSAENRKSLSEQRKAEYAAAKEKRETIEQENQEAL